MRKNILITGASSGLGKGMAKEFANKVVILLYVLGALSY